MTRFVWPILLAAALMEAILIGGRETARFSTKLEPAWLHTRWAFMGLALFFQALLSYAGVLAMRRLLPRADAHVRWPPGRSYALHAVLLGIAMGLVMLVADYWPELLAGRTPDERYDSELWPAVAMLLALLCTGFAEETLFRGLLTGMLAVLVPGRVRFAGVDLPLAAYIVSAMFGLAHWESFVRSPLHLAIAQQLYAFVFGLVYVWLMERSRSLLAPIIAHGIGNAVEVAIVTLWLALG